LGFSINREVFVEEAVCTLVGGTGLMLTGPIANLIACWMVKRGQGDMEAIEHGATETA
jgi:uncharacterized membrane protein